MRFADPLPGVVNSFTGADTQKWVTGIPRYATAHLAEVYPGIDAQYVMEAGGQLTLKLLLRPGVDPKAVVFEVPKAVAVERSPDGASRVRLGPSRIDPLLVYPPPVAFQEAASGRVSRSVSFEVRSTTGFGFRVEEQGSTLPLQIEMKLTAPACAPVFGEGCHVVDAAGNTFVAAAVPDAAGKDAPFPTERWEGCGISIAQPVACSDIAVRKFSKAGELVFVSYLAGRTREEVSFLRLAPDGALILTGSTDSADFPVTGGVLQTMYAGPGGDGQFLQLTAGCWRLLCGENRSGCRDVASFHIFWRTKCGQHRRDRVGGGRISVFHAKLARQIQRALTVSRNW